MIMFTSKSNRIFAQVIDDYHRCDDVDAPVRNPYANGSIEYLLYLKNWIDTVQWHLEDIIRDPNIDPVEALHRPLESGADRYGGVHRQLFSRSVQGRSGSC